MLCNIEKNKYKLYYRADIEDLGLPLFMTYDDHLYSKSRLKREKKLSLTKEQENNPHAFGLGRNGYYPLWDINKLSIPTKE